MTEYLHDHGAYHLSNNPTMYEPQRTNNFEFIVTDLDNITRAAPSNYATEDKTIANAQQILYFSVVSVSLPHFSQSPIAVQRGNTEMYVAGKPSYGTNGSLTVNDYIGADSKSVLMAWQALSFDVETEAVGRMADYKKDCTLVEYTPDYKNVVRYYDLKGCWVSSISENKHDYHNNDKGTIDATIIFDKSIMRLPDIE